MSEQTQAIASARAAKAITIIEWLRREFRDDENPLTAEELRRFDDRDWKIVATLAGVRVPSERTIELVINAFARTEAAAADPFDGL